MAAAAIEKGLDFAIKAGPYIQEGIEVASKVITSHRDRISQLRALDEKINGVKQQISVLEAWHRGKNIALPKQGGSIIGKIGEAVEGFSKRWYDNKNAAKLKDLATLEAYRLILEKSKQLASKTGAGPKHRMVHQGGSVIIEGVGASRGSGSSSGGRARVRDSMTGMRSNPNVKAYPS